MYNELKINQLFFFSEEKIDWSEIETAHWSQDHLMLNLNVNDFCTVESNRKSLVLPSIILSIEKYPMKAKHYTYGI